MSLKVMFTSERGQTTWVAKTLEDLEIGANGRAGC